MKNDCIVGIRCDRDGGRHLVPSFLRGVGKIRR